MTTRNRSNTLILIAGDLAIFVVFVLVGRETHAAGDPNLIINVLPTLLPFVLIWFMVAISMGVKLEIWVAVFMYAVVEFIQQLNWVIPSGFGVVDAGLTGAFVLTGLPLSLASALSLLTRFATNWVELILYAPVAFSYGYRELLRARPRVPS